MEHPKIRLPFTPIVKVNDLDGLHLYSPRIDLPGGNLHHSASRQGSRLRIAGPFSPAHLPPRLHLLRIHPHHHQKPTQPSRKNRNPQLFHSGLSPVHRKILTRRLSPRLASKIHPTPSRCQLHQRRLCHRHYEPDRLSLVSDCLCGIRNCQESRTQVKMAGKTN